MGIRLADLIRSSERKADGYSRVLQAARVRAAHQRSYFAPALFNLIPVETTLIGSMAVDSHWRLYYNDAWLASHTVEENATLLIHEVGHLLRNHEGRKRDAGVRDDRRWNTAGDCEINDDLHAEGLPLPGDPPLPYKYGLQDGETAGSVDGVPVATYAILGHRFVVAGSASGDGKCSGQIEILLDDVNPLLTVLGGGGVILAIIGLIAVLLFARSEGGCLNRGLSALFGGLGGLGLALALEQFEILDPTQPIGLFILIGAAVLGFITAGLFGGPDDVAAAGSTPAPISE